MNRTSPTSSHPIDRREALRLSILGINAWLVAVVVPSLHVGIGSALELVVGLVPLAVLGFGVLALREHVARARWTLLLGVPASLGAVIASRPHLVERDAYGSIGIVLAAASLLAFVAASAHAVGRDRVAKAAETQPIVSKEPVVEPPARRALRRALLASATIGALALTILGPTLSSRRERVALWGEAADDATVLTIVVATIVASIALGTIVGPALRAERPRRDPPARARRRIVAAMVIAIAAFAGWVVLAHFDHAG